MMSVDVIIDQNQTSFEMKCHKTSLFDCGPVLITNSERICAAFVQAEVKTSAALAMTGEQSKTIRSEITGST